MSVSQVQQEMGRFVMSVTLQVLSGPFAGRKLHVGRGQIAKFGRTDWADISFPSDSGMADVHFEIHENGPGCVIIDSSGGIGTLVNGEDISETRLHTGDVVTAGETTFAVTVDGEAAPVIVPAAADESAADDRATNAVPLAADYARRLTLSDPANALLDELMVPEAFIELLIQHEFYADAFRFIAFLLPRPIAVGWGCDCVEQALSDGLTLLDKNAIDAARAWSTDPNETNCRAAENAAAATEHTGAPGWLALGAFWSGDSLAPADLPPVPPGEALAAEAICGALIMAATCGTPAQTIDRYQLFVKNGQNLVRETAAAYQK